MNPDYRIRLCNFNTSGPSPRKRMACGFCSGLTDKEKRKIDSCPECGKSMFAFKRKKKG